LVRNLDDRHVRVANDQAIPDEIDERHRMGEIILLVILKNGPQARIVRHPLHVGNHVHQRRAGFSVRGMAFYPVNGIVQSVV